VTDGRWREANDRGFDCLVISDCCAATERHHHEAALSMIQMQGGSSVPLHPPLHCWTGWGGTVSVNMQTGAA